MHEPATVTQQDPAAPVAALDRAEAPPAYARVLELQRSIGNRGVSRLLAASGRRTLARYNSGEHAQFGAPGAGMAFKIHGVDMTYGEMIAMGDFFKEYDDIYKMDSNALGELVKLVRTERDDGIGSVSEKQWSDAAPAYIDLASDNDTHFAPTKSKPSFTAWQKNHKTEWFKWHKRALEEAHDGNQLNALAINAFGDHFLTDAFASGHQVNKQQVMELAEANVDRDPATFERAVARVIMADPRSGPLMGYDVNPGVGKAWMPMSEDALVALIDRLRYWKRMSGYAFLNNFAKIVHDRLNHSAGTADAVQVLVGGGKAFDLAGDETLAGNQASLDAGRAAVAVSRQQILDVDPKGAKPDAEALAEVVWKLVPVTTKLGQAHLDAVVAEYTDPTRATTQKAFAGVILANVGLLITKLLAKGFIRVTPPPPPVPTPQTPPSSSLPGGVADAPDGGTPSYDPLDAGVQ